MASITREPNGRRTIQFVGGDGKRRSIRLGKVSHRDADAVKLHVERLVAASITGHAVPNDTAEWLTTIGGRLCDRLAAVGLVPQREAATLAAFIDGYVEARSDVKASTATVYGHTRRNLIDHFGPDKLLRDITPGDADAWRLGLIAQGLADNTVRRRCGIAKQFFRAAVRRKLIPSNPFADLVAAVKANASRFYFVTRKDADRISNACPDAQWRLLFALSRYGGLRCPSEHLALRWADIDWERNRITVRSPKTEHHAGGDRRQVPLFPELLPHLRDVFEQAEPGTEHVITRYRDTNQNLRTQLERIIRRAGLKPWPKPFQNLRSSRETELAERWPLHVVCAWIGNSQPVAAKHYLQVTDEHFERAAAAEAAPEPVQNPVQNPVQQPAAECRIASQGENAVSEKDGDFHGLRDDATLCDTWESGGMGGKGLEPLTFSV